ncbi:MAG: hypothetical protein U0R29_00390 [Solirubrobacterales bacterium]
MERGFLRGIVVAASLVFGVMAVSSPALALTPPPVDKASVVFSNGKRLIRIKADATDREVLTLKNSFVSSIDGFTTPPWPGRPTASRCSSGGKTGLTGQPARRA